jgi:PAS domain S-box-containing protein
MAMTDDILAAKILIVDDQPANVQLLTRLLTEAGYSAVTSTMDPTTVYALHARHGHDLILLDLQMPGKDGFEVMDDLRLLQEAEGGEGYLPVIVLTAQPAHKLRALQAGAKDFISKPFDLLEVKTRIHNMLEVRLLYRQLAAHAADLEALVLARTAELRESEARYRSLTELASDWYWEQDPDGNFVRTSGPVFEMLGIHDPLPTSADLSDAAALSQGWDLAERQGLQQRIAARQPFLDYAFHRRLPDGTRQQFRVSGQPMFDAACRFTGYRGVGVDVTAGH